MIKITNFMNSNDEKLNKIRKDILTGFELALNSVDPYKSVLNKIIIKDNQMTIHKKTYDLKKFENIRLISFGKASIKMADAILSILPIRQGIIIGVQESFPQFNNIKYIKGGHPVPDENSYIAGKEILKIADLTSDNDLTFILISGGGSALVESSSISLERVRNLTKELLKNGADINELNTVRKHFSEIKGGRLLKRLKGTVISLIISDVVSDPLDIIASGPTYFDSSTFLDAYKILGKYNLLADFEDFASIFKKGIKGEIEETLKENEKIKSSFDNILAATNCIAINTLKDYLKNIDYSVLSLGSEIEGDALLIARIISSIGKSIANDELKTNRPVAIIFGGETTVKVKGNGIGGRNSELTLYMAKFLKDKKFVFSSIGTDGIDGVSPASGAICDSETIVRALQLNLKIDDYLENNDSYTFFHTLNDSIITGPTGTNVADIATLVIL